MLDQFLSTDYYENLDYCNNLEPFNEYQHIFSKAFQESSALTKPLTSYVFVITESSDTCTMVVEVSPEKILYINSRLDFDQQKQLTHMLQKQFGAFAWEYKDMCGIHLDICIHHIYTQENARLVKQP